MVLVKLQSLPDDGHVIGHVVSGGEFEGVGRSLLGIRELADFSVGHRHRINHNRLIAAGEVVRSCRHRECGIAVANLRIFVRGQHLREIGQHLGIVRIQFHRPAEKRNGFRVAALFEQHLPNQIRRVPVGRGQSRGLGVFVHGLVKPAQFNQQRAKIVVRAT